MVPFLQGTRVDSVSERKANVWFGPPAIERYLNGNRARNVEGSTGERGNGLCDASFGAGMSDGWGCGAGRRSKATNDLRRVRGRRVLLGVVEEGQRGLRDRGGRPRSRTVLFSYSIAQKLQETLQNAVKVLSRRAPVKRGRGEAALSCESGWAGGGRRGKRRIAIVYDIRRGVHRDRCPTDGGTFGSGLGIL